MTNGMQGDVSSGGMNRGERTAADLIPAPPQQLGHSLSPDDVAFLGFDHRRRQEAQEVLAAASAMLGRSLDLRETADAIARAAIPRFADWAVVDAPDENGRLARLAVAPRAPALLAAGEAIERRWPPDFEREALTNTVLATGAPVLISDFRDE